MGCEVRAHLADYLADRLPPEEMREVAAHLETCRACAAEFAAMAETWQALGEIPAAQPDSVAMRGRFDAMLAERMPAGRILARPAPSSSPSVADGRVLPWSAGRVAAWAGAAAAVLLLGVGIGRITAGAPAKPVADPQVSALRDELGQMRQLLTLTLLQQQSASDRLKAVTSAGDIDGPGDELAVALLDALMHDPNVNVRMATVDALRRFSDRETVRRGVVEAMTRQTSPLVQIALIDFVVETNSREAADALRHLSTDPAAEEAVRARAAAGLTQVGA